MKYLILIFMVLPIAEIYMMFKVGSVFGAANTFFLLLLMVVIGVGLVRTQGQALILRTQATLARGEIPANVLLHGLLVMFSGIMFVIPGFLTDVLGLLCLLPGSRHAIALSIALWLKFHFARQLRSGRLRFFGEGMPQGFGGEFRAGPFQQYGGSQDNRQSPFTQERDVSQKVIDVTPVAPRKPHQS